MKEYEEFDEKFKDASIDAIAISFPVPYTEEQKEAEKILDLLLSLEDDSLKIQYECYKQLKSLLRKNTSLDSLEILKEYAGFLQSIMVKFDYLVDRETKKQLEDYQLRFYNNEDYKNDNE
jgi:hypothetical protein